MNALVSKCSFRSHKSHTFFLTLVLSFASLVTIDEAVAKTFNNCTELNKVFRGGVALPGAVNSGGKTRFAPKFSKKLYLENQKSDRDKDGIACER